MGRNPFYADHVRPLPARHPPLQELEEIFSQFFTMGKVIVYEDDVQVATFSKQKEIQLQLMECQRTPRPCLERSCSIYRKKEDYFPERKQIYKVKTAILYRFQNQHSNHEPFEFRVLELEPTKDEYYTTFCLTIEGEILNLESLSLRGYVSKLVRL
jgi:hypothetical protein